MALYCLLSRQQLVPLIWRNLPPGVNLIKLFSSSVILLGKHFPAPGAYGKGEHLKICSTQVGPGLLANVRLDWKAFWKFQNFYWYFSFDLLRLLRNSWKTYSLCCWSRSTSNEPKHWELIDFLTSTVKRKKVNVYGKNLYLKIALRLIPHFRYC